MDTLSHWANKAQKLLRNMDMAPSQVVHFMSLEPMGTENCLHIKIDVNIQIVPVG
jgi:hypothetical protein